MSNTTSRSRFSIHKDDTDPPIDDTLMDEDRNAKDLTGASVDFIMKDPTASSAKVSAAATVVNASAGEVEYEWSSGDTDTTGWYKAEWEVTYGDGDIETFPTEPRDYVIVHVEETSG